MENYFDMSSMEQLSPVSPTARLVGKLFTILQMAYSENLLLRANSTLIQLNSFIAEYLIGQKFGGQTCRKISHDAENLSA